MATIPTDIQEGIKKMSESTKIPIQSLVGRIKEIMQTNETIKVMEKEEHKIRFAFALLYRENSMASKTTECFIKPICNPRVREITMKKGDKTPVGDITAIVQKIEKDNEGNPVMGDVLYGAGTFWRDGANNLKKLEVGKTYKTSLVIKDNKWGVSITSDRAGFLETDQKLPDFKSFYEQNIKPKNLLITLVELDLNKSDDNTDIREIEVTVIESEVSEKEGREYGRYVVMDNSTMEKMGNQVIFVHPKDVIWAQGSVLRFGGHIDVDQETGAVRWTNHYILPTAIAIPKEIIAKPVKGRQEEVDIGMKKSEPEMSIDVNLPSPIKAKPVNDIDANFAI